MNADGRFFNARSTFGMLTAGFLIFGLYIAASPDSAGCTTADPARTSPILTPIAAPKAATVAAMVFVRFSTLGFLGLSYMIASD
jgi:hypothetical protein